MYLSGKYIILYVGAGVATGILSKGDKNAALIGLGVSALVGASFGLSYALISAIEFGIGLAIASMFNNKR
jgi:hypothetical protein